MYISLGDEYGAFKMGEISDINYKKLIRTSDNLFRLETLQNANDKIINQLFKLDIFSQYHINDLIHSTTDGQKYETKISTMNSTYSPKYFGLKRVLYHTQWLLTISL